MIHRGRKMNMFLLRVFVNFEDDLLYLHTKMNQA
jgi:hypothetical protein